MYLNNKLYDVLKWVALYVLPSLGALYFALAGIWGVPYPDQIVGTIVAVDVFLGALLGLSTIQYNRVKNEYIDKNEGNSFGASNLTTGFDEDGSLKLPIEMYEILKWVALILFPAFGALYFTLSELWGFPYGTEIVGTMAAITAFLGLALGVSKARFVRSEI